MKNKGFASIVLPLLVIAIIGVLILLLKNNIFQLQIKEVKNSEQTTALTDNPELDLSTFNSNDAFTFKYPSNLTDWKTEDGLGMPHHYVTYPSPLTDGGGGHYSDFRLGVTGPYPKTNLDLSTWVKENYPSIVGDYGSGPLETFSRTVIVNGIETIQQQHTDEGTTIPATRVVFFKINEDMYQIYFNNQIASVSKLMTFAQQNDQTFDKIVATLTSKK